MTNQTYSIATDEAYTEAVSVMFIQRCRNISYLTNQSYHILYFNLKRKSTEQNTARVVSSDVG